MAGEPQDTVIRPSHRGDGPTVSVVVTSPVPGAALIECLTALFSGSDGGLEAIVVSRGGAGAGLAIGRAFAGARVIAANPQATIPDMRAAGLRAARGDVVAMTTEYAVPCDGWLPALREAHRRGAAVVGGPLVFEGERLVDWAVVFCEYGRYLAPVPGGKIGDLPAHNVSYTRAALAEIDDLLSLGLWEPFWHQRLIDRGVGLTCDPAVMMRIGMRYSFGSFVRERYHFGRSFAAQRVAGRAWPARLAMAAASPLLPAILLVRTLRQVVPKRRYTTWLVRTLPLLAIFVVVWAIGECAGYAFGAGGSARQVG